MNKYYYLKILNIIIFLIFTPLGNYLPLTNRINPTHSTLASTISLSLFSLPNQNPNTFSQLNTNNYN